jgi:hypothetical protein
MIQVKGSRRRLVLCQLDPDIARRIPHAVFDVPHPAGEGWRVPAAEGEDETIPIAQRGRGLRDHNEMFLPCRKIDIVPRGDRKVMFSHKVSSAFQEVARGSIRGSPLE